MNKNFSIIKFLLGIFCISIILECYIPAKKAQADLLGVGDAAIVAAINAANVAITASVNAGTASNQAAILASQIAVIGSQVALIGAPGTGGLPFLPVSTALTACVQSVSGIDNLFDSGAGKFSDFATLGVSPKEAIVIEAKLESLRVLRTCYEVAIEKTKPIPAPNLAAATEKNTLITDWTTQSNQVKVRIEDLNNRLNQSTKRVLTAVAVQILINVGKKMTASLLMEVNGKFAIGSYMQRAADLESNFYSTEYILTHYKDADDQQIIRALLTSAKAGVDYASPLITLKARDNLGLPPDLYSIQDPNFETNMARVGGLTMNEYTLGMLYRDQRDVTTSAARMAAAQQIDSEKGYMSSFNCPKSFGEQRALDQQRNNFSSEMSTNRQIVDELVSARAPASEIQKAQAALDTSTKNYNNYKIKNPAVYQVCSGIASPGAWVNTMMDKYLEKYFGEVSSLGKENLPLLGNLLVQLGDRFADQLLRTGNANPQLLLSDGLQAVGLVANSALRGSQNLNQIAAQAGNTSDTNNTNVVFTITPGVKNGDIQEFTLTWDASKLAGASKALLKGPGVLNSAPGPASIQVPLAGTQKVQTTDSSLYQLQVLDANGVELALNSLEAKIGAVNGLSVSLESSGFRGSSWSFR